MNIGPSVHWTFWISDLLNIIPFEHTLWTLNRLQEHVTRLLGCLPPLLKNCQHFSMAWKEVVERAYMRLRLTYFAIFSPIYHRWFYLCSWPTCLYAYRFCLMTHTTIKFYVVIHKIIMHPTIYDTKSFGAICFTIS